MPKLGAQKSNAQKIGGEAFTEVVQTQADLYKSDTGDSTVSLDQLYEKSYLSKKQYEKAKNEKIVIDSDEETK